MGNPYPGAVEDAFHLCLEDLRVSVELRSYRIFNHNPCIIGRHSFNVLRFFLLQITVVLVDVVTDGEFSTHSCFYLEIPPQGVLSNLDRAQKIARVFD